MEKVTSKLAEFTTNLNYQNLSEETILQCKKCLLDFLGVAACGMGNISSKAMVKCVESMAPSGVFSLIGVRKKTSVAQYAALANGTAAHSLELDDVHEEASIHPGVGIFPAALAAAQLTNCSGKNFIAGVIAGYEIGVRLGIGLRPEKSYKRGFHPTGLCDVFGAAAAVSKILNLSHGELINAFGLAGSMASGLHEYQADGSWSKRLHAGIAAQNGLLACLLAREGFKGPATVIEGREGFLQAFSEAPAIEEVCRDLGTSYAINRISHKVHACCRYMHAPIDGLIKIVKENNLCPADINKVQLGILDVAFPIIVEPISIKLYPKNSVSAQFSIFYGAAISILKMKASLGEFSEENISSSEVKELMQRIQCIRDQRLDDLFPKTWPATVKIETFRGDSFDMFVDNPRGSPNNPFTWEELIDKFKFLTQGFNSYQQQSVIINTVDQLEKQIDLSILFEAI